MVVYMYLLACGHEEYNRLGGTCPQNVALLYELTRIYKLLIKYIINISIENNLNFTSKTTHKIC